MGRLGAWFFLLAACCCCCPTAAGLSSASGASESRRNRRTSCKPGGRRARSYLDTTRLWERDLTELRLYLDDKFYEFGNHLEALRSQVADVGNDVSRLRGQECDSSGQSPLHLPLERLENSLAGLLLRLEERLTHPAAEKPTNITTSQKKPTTPAPLPTPQPMEMGPTPDKVDSAINTKHPRGKQISPAISCFWYEPSVSNAASSIVRRQVDDREEDDGLKVCSHLDPGQPPKESLLKDCSDGPLPRPPGVYWIQPNEMRKPIRVFCDAEGWTVVQRRGMSPVSSPESFNRSWMAYTKGFGDLCTDFWIGNSLLHRLTTAYNASLRVQFSGVKGAAIFNATYGRFYVGKENKGFPLTVGDFQGDAKDGLGFQSGMPFATKDRAWSPLALTCANLEGSGWWVSETAYSHMVQCNHHLLGSNLNAPYTPFTTLHDEFVKLCPLHNGSKVYQHVKYANAIYWRGKYLTVSPGFINIEMKMRPKA